MFHLFLQQHLHRFVSMLRRFWQQSPYLYQLLTAIILLIDELSLLFGAVLNPRSLVLWSRWAAVCLWMLRKTRISYHARLIGSAQPLRQRQCQAERYTLRQCVTCYGHLGDVLSARRVYHRYIEMMKRRHSEWLPSAQTMQAFDDAVGVHGKG